MQMLLSVITQALFVDLLLQILIYFPPVMNEIYVWRLALDGAFPISKPSW